MNDDNLDSSYCFIASTILSFIPAVYFFKKEPDSFINLFLFYIAFWIIFILIFVFIFVIYKMLRQKGWSYEKSMIVFFITGLIISLLLII